jgi:formamidopyrimidine-DNA glycosylase
MPEIVEVKLLTDSLNRYLQGKYIKWYQAQNTKTKKYLTFWNKVKDQKFKVIRIHQKGKLIIFDLLDQNKQPVFILNELRLTGHWTKLPVPEKNHRFFHIRTSGALKTIWYSDYRGFGTFTFIDQELEMGKFLASRGPDILSDVTEKVFVEAMKTKPQWQIVKAILDQALISGIGNWIKSDALYHAKIDPRKRINQLSDSDLKRLYHSIMYVINDSLKKGGSSGYVDFNGNVGGYTFLIYDKKEVKEGVVKTIKLTDGRTTHYVPNMFIK